MKARKVVTRSGRKFRGYFPSKKLNRMIEWESILERDAILYFEFSPGIKTYKEQPERVIYEHLLKTREYFPDFELVLNNGKVIHIEVKPFKKLNTYNLLSKFGAIADRYEAHSAEFRVVTDDLLRRKPLLNNLKRLFALLHCQEDISKARSEVHQLLATGLVLSVDALGKKCGLKSVLIMLANHELICDLYIDLFSSVNFVRLALEGDHDTVLI